MKPCVIIKLVVLTFIVMLILFIFPWERAGLLFAKESVESLATRAGLLGPIAIIVLMWFAVVASPIPSAPIAIAAGALYGHTFGAVYVAVGAELGAITAFLIARYFAKDAVRHWTGGRLEKGLLGSQNALTWTVFLSRLMPFVSFDAFSYAAGISKIHFWRFAVATFLGIVPASVVLAHVGTSAFTGDVSQASWIVLGLGLATAMSVGLGTFWAGQKGKNQT